MRYTSVLLASLLFALATGASLPARAADGDGFPVPTCAIPFADIAQRTDFDDQCGMEGADDAQASSITQNKVKNNFCASGSPLSMSHDDLVRLQKATDKTGTPYTTLQAKRSLLKDLITLDDGTSVSEGQVVQVVGFINDAHYSDLGGGESVNCKMPDKEQNDIHIPIVEDAGDAECTSVTAEIVPHYRPAAITPDLLNGIDHPVRFRGQLFFDASHHPALCVKKGQKQQHPARVSSWEIHPVYGIDVCEGDTIEACPVGDDTKWTTIEKWMKQHH